MDVFLLIVGLICVIIGFAGCVLPGLPGPPLSYIGLLLLEWTEFADFSTQLLVILLIVVVIVTVMDYVFPIYMTKNFGGGKGGTWGATIGLVIGMIFFALPGTIIGPFVGALVGELIAGKEGHVAFKSAIGSFVGFILGTGAKLITCGVIFFYYCNALWQYFF